MHVLFFNMTWFKNWGQPFLICNINYVFIVTPCFVPEVLIKILFCNIQQVVWTCNSYTEEGTVKWVVIITGWKMVIIVSNKKKSIMVFNPYSPKGTAYLNKYDSKDCLDYYTSNSDIQKVCQMLNFFYHKLVW